jgi:hypothetical protein
MPNYDVIIIGSGAGGGTLARSLAPTGKRILILERGDWLKREAVNWDAKAVFVDNRYVSPDTLFAAAVSWANVTASAGPIASSRCNSDEISVSRSDAPGGMQTAGTGVSEGMKNSFTIDQKFRDSGVGEFAFGCKSDGEVKPMQPVSKR